MPSPFALLLLFGAGGLLLAQGQKKTSTPQTTLPPSGGGGDPGVLPLGCELDDKLPPSYKDMLAALVGKAVPNEQADAWIKGLDKVSDNLASAGYPKAAACAKLRADALRKQLGGSAPPPPAQPTPDKPPALPNVPVPPPPAVPAPVTASDMPFVVRVGDRPYGLALYYTGNGSRMFELAQKNPQMGSLQSVNGVSTYSGWKPGLAILIPAGWHPQEKPLPQPGL